jgi:hypothetical protein
VACEYILTCKHECIAKGKFKGRKSRKNNEILPHFYTYVAVKGEKYCNDGAQVSILKI